jgi:glutamate synthase (NADPH/NADH) small chain
MDKRTVDRRVEQLEAEGVRFRSGVDVGVDVDGSRLRREFDAIILATGALAPREVALPGRQLDGIHQAMVYLPMGNRVQAGDLDAPPISAQGLRVVIIGGGDTADDCLGTANRQGAVEVHQLDHNPRPPEQRDDLVNPWPQVPKVHKLSPAREEGVAEGWATEAVEFVGDERGHVRAVRVMTVDRRYDANDVRRFEPVEGSEEDIPADLVLLAAGFAGTDARPLLEQLKVAVDPARGTVLVDETWETSSPGVFACGDAQRGASLVVWAIAEARACAAAVDAYLMGETSLPSPVTPTSRPL